jgi:hypothetical protein
VKYLLIGTEERIILLASFSIYLYCYLVIEVKWVISKWALWIVFLAPFCQIWGPKTFLQAANTTWVPVWNVLSVNLLSSSICPITDLPVKSVVTGLSIKWSTAFPIFWTSIT